MRTINGNIRKDSPEIVRLVPVTRGGRYWKTWTRAMDKIEIYGNKFYRSAKLNFILKICFRFLNEIVSALEFPVDFAASFFHSFFLCICSSFQPVNLLD